MSKDKQPFEDDGRTIANMDIPGMPWYNPERKKKNDSSENAIEQLSREGQRAMTGGVLLASLLVGGVFVLGFLLFILFCIYVWF
ncbi:MAG: phage holin family protein [Ruminococcaceae bacterium]|nr:phage holin family protein [Oscillospiraceae bacterium]